jgi:hypothetical protein
MQSGYNRDASVTNSEFAFLGGSAIAMYVSLCCSFHACFRSLTNPCAPPTLKLQVGVHELT